MHRSSTRHLARPARLLGDELRAVAAWLRAPELWLALVAGLALWTLAYRAPYAFRLDFGGDQASGRRYDDAPYVFDFHAPEPSDGVWWAQWRKLDPAQIYRWTSEDSTIHLPGVGAGAWMVRISAGAQPTDQPTHTRWSAGAGALDLAITRDPQHDRRVYSLLGSAPDGDLTIRLVTDPLAPPNDPRLLGFRAYRATIAPVGAPAPPLGQLALLAAVAALLYGSCRRVGMGGRAALLATLAFVALAALLLARARLGLTSFTPALLPLAAACYALTAAGARALVSPVLKSARVLSPSRPGLAVKPSVNLRARPAWIVGCVALAFALRLGGMLHPHTIFSDLGLHLHNLEGVTRGEVYFTEGLPARAGGGQAPYPPGQYLALAPFQLILPAGEGARRILVMAGGALWDSLAVALLWYVLRRSGAGDRAALMGAALYIVAPPLLKSFSVGEFANIFGQGLALPLLATLALAGDRIGARRVHLAIGALLALALLGHLGVGISVALLLACLAGLWLAAQRRALPWLLLVGAAVGLLVAAFYYSAFAGLLAARASAAAPPGPALSFGAKLAAQLADNRGITLLAAALGALGLALPRMRRAAPSARRGLWLILLAWWGATLLSFGMLLFTNQSVRWQHFLYPALCLGAGPALGALWARGRAGRVVAGAALAFLLADGVAQWVAQLADYMHT